MSQTKKNNIIINPKTNRPIKIGGRVYNKLIRDGTLRLNNNSSKVIFKFDNSYTDDQLENIKNTLQHQNDDDYNIVKGRGIYENTLVKSHSKLKPNDVIPICAKIISHIFENNIEDWINLSDAELESKINLLLLNS
jgi:hypothetical protein